VNTVHVRARFAPAPTGMMHLGNIRVAVLNYIFAKKYNGTFIIRIEDTDAERNYDPQAHKILSDLAWLGLVHDEGPVVNGHYRPYFQSQRTTIYQEKLDELIAKGAVYRCFCSPEELEKKRQRQLALKMPPRYDRACLNLLAQEITQKLERHLSFIWRLKTTSAKTIIIHDLAHGPMSFNLKDFSDTPLTRSDGSFTFIFANGIDDIMMKITHVIRGEDHMTNTAAQTVLYEALDTSLPEFWHLPIVCNIDGKKLSKRDFGFSLNDLKEAGFLAEALVNYLALIGGGPSLPQEILNLNKLIQIFDRNHIRATGHITYDLEKLRWINHQWIALLPLYELTSRCQPFLAARYQQAQTMSIEQLTPLIAAVKTDLVTLADSATALRFYFEPPTVNTTDLTMLSAEKKRSLTDFLAQQLDQEKLSLEYLKKDAQHYGLNNKELFTGLRFILTGSAQGLGIKELFELLSPAQIRERLNNVLP
jgi:glutamyl-tRNA synthetase